MAIGRQVGAYCRQRYGMHQGAFTINRVNSEGWKVAGERGFEPRLTVSETAVLPLDDSPNTSLFSMTYMVGKFSVHVMYNFPNIFLF